MELMRTVDTRFVDYNRRMKHSFDLEKHLKEEHKISPFSTYLREIVYGGTDGIVTTFAIVAGFAGAQQNEMTALPVLAVLLFGFANLFADGASMGLGNFLSTRSEQDLYSKEEKKERHEVRTNTAMEKEESIAIFKQKGFTNEQAKQLVEIYSTNEDYWVEFMMTQELEMDDPTNNNALFMALATFLAFLGFGFIPLVPYITLQTNPHVFLYSCLATAFALIILGLLRWRVTRTHFVRAVGETLLVGGISSIISYLVGSMFKL